MSAPITQHEVEALLLDENGALDKITSAVAKRARDRAEKRVAWKVGYARAFLAGTGTVAEREAQATVAAESEMLDYEMADAVLVAAREAGSNEREKASNTRSVNANHRQLVS